MRNGEKLSELKARRKEVEQEGKKKDPNTKKAAREREVRSRGG